MDFLVGFAIIYLLSSPLVLGYKDTKVIHTTQIRTKRSSAAEFRVSVHEKGSIFTEKVKADTSRRAVLYTVPAHSGVDRSEVLDDFTNNMTVTRYPDLKVCQIRPMSSDEPSPRKLISDMKMASSPETVHKRGIITISTQWAIEDQVSDARALSALAQKFCRGLPIYRLKKLEEDSVTYETKSRRRRSTQVAVGFDTCQLRTSYSLTGCTLQTAKYYCKVVAATCIYQYICTYDDVTKDKYGCSDVHKYGGTFCCIPRCA